MPRRNKKADQIQKMAMYGFVIGLIVLLFYMFLYYTYYEWGQEEDVVWLTHNLFTLSD